MKPDEEKTNAVDPEIVDGNVEHSFEFAPIGYHEWKQQGNMISCSSCPHSHGASVAQGMVLSKNSEGDFILTKEY